METDETTKKIIARDDSFSVFIDAFGEATFRIDAGPSSLKYWQGKVPNQLVSWWQSEGFGGYKQGLFWLVDPSFFEDLVKEWLDGSPLESVDTFHVVARTAFGDLFLSGENTGCVVTIAAPLNMLISSKDRLYKKSSDELDISARALLGISPEECDFKDEMGEFIFEKVLARLGPLNHDEVYGFEPPLVAGGRPCVEQIGKLKLDQYLTILRQIAKPESYVR